MNFNEIFEELVKHFGADKIATKKLFNFIGTPNEKIGPIQDRDEVGGEYDGDDLDRIKYLPAHDIFIRVSSTYSSYSDTTFYDLKSSVDQVTGMKTIVMQWLQVNDTD
jgi:hypothetical protein